MKAGKSSSGAARTVRTQRAIQARVDAKPAKKAAAGEKKPAVQAGSRREPVPPLPAQPLGKPGL